MPSRPKSSDHHIKPATSPRTVPARLDMRARLRAMTSADNSEILTGLREIVKDQVSRMTALSTNGAFGPSQAGALHRLAQTYTILSNYTDREQSKYDLQSMDSEDLDGAVAAARRLLGDGDGT